MDDLIIRSLMGETTAEEERQLMRWRAAAPQNDERYRSLGATWELAGLAWEPEQREPPPAAEIIARAREEMDGTPRGESSRGGRLRRGRLLTAAAMLAAAAVAGILVLSPAGPADAEAPYTVVAEDAQTVRLSDGSAAHLAPGSALTIDPSRPRIVRLEGRAYFGITHNPGNPFLVQTRAGVARVLGTRFDLTARGGELTVVVVEGRVEVVSDSGEVEVGPGEQSRIAPGRAPVVGRADVSAVTDWMGRVFIFQSTPLSAVVAELQQRFEREFIIADPLLADRTVTAVFADRPLHEILPALCRAVAAQCTTTPETVRLTL